MDNFIARTSLSSLLTMCEYMIRVCAIALGNMKHIGPGSKKLIYRVSSPAIPISHSSESISSHVKHISCLVLISGDTFKL